LKSTFRIAEWKIQPQLNSATHGDHSVHLEPKVMQVLVLLASHANEVLSKDQLIQAVWPGTFVGDDVLTRCISELRRVFDDDARAPRFIQTIPKAGYRLIMPVSIEEEISLPPPTKGGALGQASAPAVAPETISTAPAASTVRSKVFLSTTGSWVMLTITLIFGVSLWFAWSWPAAQHVEMSYKTVPLTSNPGSETQPAFSPDGNQIAYVWNGDPDGYQHIYAKLIGTETSLKLTSGKADDVSPTWSPDARSIAFMRVSPQERGIYIIPAIGGAARKVFGSPPGLPDWTPLGRIEWDRGALSWSPDGKHLIFSDGKTSDRPSSIYSLDLATMETNPLTSPVTTLDGDFSPMYSPDGKKIAFVRGLEGAIRDIYVMNSDGNGLRRITSDNRFVAGLAWTSDSASLVFSSNRGGKFSLWRISLNDVEPTRLPFGGDDAFAPAISLRGKRLAYAQRSARWSIMRLDIRSPRPTPTRLLVSTAQDSAPQLSPDGSKIAFQSWRSGDQEIWISSADGSDLVKLTSFDGPLTGSPSWSPNGQMIAFDTRPNGHSQIYVIGVTGGKPRAITGGKSNDIVPSFSRDGQWIYFGSNRSGNWQMWKVSSAGGTPKQVTTQGGFVGSESIDGKWLYYTKPDSAGIWRVPVSGGEEAKILSQPGVGYWGYWCFRGNELLYVTSSQGSPAIESYDLVTGRTKSIFQLQHAPPPFAGLTASPDGNSLVFADLTEAGSQITLVENFE
jgi:Tol biopolymer transport system component/DNA-binding winged helix-turn-helix (wHTH) protein